MNNPKNQQSYNERDVDGTDRIDQSTDGGIDNSSSIGASSSDGETSTISVDSRQNRGSGNDIGFTARLTDLFVGDGDGDLLIQRSNQEDTVMQWLQALDMQVFGACRADERLKPLLKLNVSSGVAEDRLLTHLSQHFEPSEVGLLARCLCIPLVSIRVGKINVQGTLLCPTSARGNLILALLPTSDLHISFVGDDGQVERLSTLSNVADCSSVVIEEIPADKSGRSFLIRIPDGESFYFWCSEKSKLLGCELLEKMRNLLKRKPSLPELTGISESRLECFATHLRAYLVGSNTQPSSVVSRSPSSITLLDLPELGQSAPLASLSSKPSRARHCSIQGAKPSSISLSPRASSFKEGGLPRNLASLRTVAREKFRRRGEGNVNLSSVDTFSVSSPSSSDASISNQSEITKLLESSRTCLFPSSSVLESPKSIINIPFLSPVAQVPPTGPSLYSPYYCWCSPVASTLQYTVAPTHIPMSSTESFSLPPLSSLLSQPPRNLAEIPSMDFPPFLPEPSARLPLSMPNSQQIPTFTPLMCDPIVHIPVIDICSSGPAYLVSAGPAISTSIPPLHQTLVNPLIRETESMVEKSARETLRLLISGSSHQANPQLMGVFTPVLNNSVEKQNIFGSRGLYVGGMDTGLVSLSEISNVTRRCIGEGDLVDLEDEPDGSSGSNEDGRGKGEPND